jgi:tetratricopeptide (TPR) repeat protein
VLAIDAQDVGANVNLGQLYAQARKYTEAAAAFRRALEVEPYNSTAVYNLALASQRAGNREEGTALLARFQELRQSGSGTSIGQNYLEQGRYAEGVVSTGAEPDLVRAETPNVTFADASTTILPPAVTGNRRDAAQPATTNAAGAGAATASPLTPDGRLTEVAQRKIAASHSGGVTLFDVDADGDLDLFEVAPENQKLYRNDAGKYTDITEASGLASVSNTTIGIGAVAADFDNDNRTDLFVLRYGAGRAGTLYRNEGNNKFTDVTATAELPAYAALAVSAALVDVEHDGDLDIFIVGFADLTKPTTGDAKRTAVATEELAHAPNLLLRNNGDGKFTDITTAAKVAGGAAHGIAVVPTDYDNRRDVDLLVVNYGAPPILYRNLRDRTFRDVSSEVGLTQTGRYTCAAAGDLNKDSFTDFFFGRAGEPSLFALSNGRGSFSVRPVGDNASGDKSAPGSPLVAIDAAQIFDYDADGLLDTVAVSDKGLRVWRNIGDGFTEVSERVLPSPRRRPPTAVGGRANSPPETLIPMATRT